MSTDFAHSLDALFGPQSRTGYRLDQTRFTITEGHVKLLARAYFQWDASAYDGAVAQGIKRPYGNSYIIQDLWEILRPDPWPDEGNEELSSEDFDEIIEEATPALLQVHREMELVVQILALSAGHGFPFAVGMTYVKTCQYDSLSWRPETGQEHGMVNLRNGVPICGCGDAGYEHLRKMEREREGQS